MEDFFPRCDVSEPGKLCSGMKLKESFEAEFLKKKKNIPQDFFIRCKIDRFSGFCLKVKLT